MVEPVNKSSSRADLEKNIRKDLRKRIPAFAVERIFWENSIPVDSRHNAKIHRLALSRKWTRLVAQKAQTRFTRMRFSSLEGWGLLETQW